MYTNLYFAKDMHQNAGAETRQRRMQMPALLRHQITVKSPLFI